MSKIKYYSLSEHFLKEIEKESSRIIKLIAYDALNDYLEAGADKEDLQNKTARLFYDKNLGERLISSETQKILFYLDGIYRIKDYPYSSDEYIKGHFKMLIDEFDTLVECMDKVSEKYENA